MDPDQPRIIRARISLADVSEIASRRFGDMVKAAVDVERELMAIGGELHADEEALLLQDGSAQADVWASISIPASPWRRGSSSIR